jgi:hypothetical protein
MNSSPPSGMSCATLAPIRTAVSLLAHLYPDAAPVLRIRDMVERQVAC